MRTKRLLQMVGLLFLLFMPMVLWGFTAPTSFWATENVADTKHNLSANQDTQLNSSVSAEICVFCHTPHGGQPQTGTAPAPAPLWNRALPDGTTFTAYNSPNFDARGTTPGVPKGVSLACLSCHDGTIAFDALINAPGSGGFFSANRGTITGTSPGTSVFGASAFQGPTVDNTNSFTDGARSGSGTNADGSPYTGGLDDFVTTGTGGVNSAGSTPFPNLTRDLTDDHPISMAIPTTDPQFDQVRTGALADGSIWKLRRVGTGITQDLSSDKRDAVRAYPTQGGTPADNITTDTAYIECASCHNPHTPRPSFLRIPSVDTATQNIPAVSIGGRGVQTGQVSTIDQYPNAGSLLCLTCHQK